MKFNSLARETVSSLSEFQLIQLLLSHGAVAHFRDANGTGSNRIEGKG